MTTEIEMRRLGAYRGSFAIEFIRQVVCRRWTFAAGETHVLSDHDRRRLRDATAGKEIIIDDSVIPAGSYRFLAHLSRS